MDGTNISAKREVGKPTMGDLDSDAWAVKESVGDILLMLADVGKVP